MSGETQKREGAYCRARITKDEALRYLSHLDYAALMQRAIRRAKLPAAYSEGFNPHMKLSFASALPVGVTSEAEYMDLELAGALSGPELAGRLRPALPKGARLLDLRMFAKKPKALMASVDEAAYAATAPLCGPFGDVQAALASFNAAQSCPYLRRTPKKTREIEVRRYMCGDVRAEERPDGTARLAMAVRIAPDGSVKPQEILAILCERFGLPIRPGEALVHRTALRGGGRDLLS